MKKRICIHGHFYQPPRENPWLDEVELQDTAYPFHDWNERISEECYAPNKASRILDRDDRIVDIVNLYSKISFNFGPTLLSWLERHRPGVYNAIVEADSMSRERYGGHGSAVAQVYNHMIMPLASRRDKVTQVLWGVGDFRRRFGREPEGMWLPETAVDYETLEVLAQQGILFTILAPRQARKVRRLSASEWEDVEGGRINPTRPYLCRLPSGGEIVLFFYDGPISQDVAFGNLLSNGESFSERLLGAFPGDDAAALVHIATDGETYGHHHRGGDMALAYCLYHIENSGRAQLTNYGEYLEKYPPEYEVELFENSSWSCVHGVERWRKHCGCHTGPHPEWTQSWREALRESMDWLGVSLGEFFAQEGADLLKSPWETRDDYVRILLNRERASVETFLREHAVRPLASREKARALKLLELQKNAQFLFTSCGWFFDDISGIESIQVLRYAAQAIQFAEELGGPPLEADFLKRLGKAPGNVMGSGAAVYNAFVRPAKLDHLRVGAHYGISSLFDDYPEEIRVYCYSCTSEDFDKVDAGKITLATGKVRVLSNLTWDEETLSFAVLHMGDQNISCGVRKFVGRESFAEMRLHMAEALARGDVASIIKLIDRHFRPHTYSVWHLFRDGQRKILDEVLRLTYEGIEASYRQIYENNYPLMNFYTSMGNPLPRPLLVAAEYVLNRDIRSVIESSDFDGEQLTRAIHDVKRWSLQIDRKMISYDSSRRITALMEEFRREPEALTPVKTVQAIIEQMKEIGVELDLWKAQNLYFSVARERFAFQKTRAERGDVEARAWLEIFIGLGTHLRVRFD